VEKRKKRKENVADAGEDSPVLHPAMHPRPAEFYNSLPKVELHRHLEGSLRLTTLREVGQAYNLDIPDADHFRQLVQVDQADPHTSQNFLSKFEVLRNFYRSPEIIKRISEEAVADAAADNVRYLELRFTPAALGNVANFPLGEVMDWVIEGVNKAQSEHKISTRLIASINLHESVEIAAKVAELAIDRLDSELVGLDLAGDEANYPAAPFEPVFKEARQGGLNITIHAGEWGPAENVAQAITLLGAERIGHGVRVMEDPEVVAMAREKGTTFEVCVTSNYQSGVVASLDKHPVQNMIQAGLNTTINTDDPGISQISLSDEYALVCEELGFTITTLQDRVLAAAQAAFLPDKERKKLAASLDREFQD
jgi:adenosine deaminase